MRPPALDPLHTLDLTLVGIPEPGVFVFSGWPESLDPAPYRDPIPPPEPWFIYDGPSVEFLDESGDHYYFCGVRRVDGTVVTLVERMRSYARHFQRAN